MNIIFSFICLTFLCAFTYSQNTITGVFQNSANQQIKLVGFNGFDNYIIDSVKVNKKGVFNLLYDQNDYGMGYLLAEDGNTFMVILDDNENIKLQVVSFAAPETVKIIEGEQNQLFEQYASEHRRREQTLSAWIYLEKIYKKDSLFADHELIKQAIEKEKQRIKAQDSSFLSSLPQNHYVSWYLPIRKLVSSVSTIAQYRTGEIPATLQAFRSLDYSDKRLDKSGLLKESIEAHFWLIENSGRSLDSVYLEMNKSIDILIESLSEDKQKLNEITEYLFKLLEKRSLFTASEFLALKLLNEKSCTINTDFAAQLESYRAMKTGNIAPDFEFKNDCLAPEYESGKLPEKLSELNSKYTVLVFAASWCSACPQELSLISGLYQKWNKYGINVVFVSLDNDKKLFKSFAGVFPFISICDYQKWESPIVKRYHIFATPTIFLLDDKRKILLRPNSVGQLDAWVDWYLVEGNK